MACSSNDSCSTNSFFQFALVDEDYEDVDVDVNVLVVMVSRVSGGDDVDKKDDDGGG
jgi:hypothetical protein